MVPVMINKMDQGKIQCWTLTAEKEWKVFTDVVIATESQPLCASQSASGLVVCFESKDELFFYNFNIR